MDKSESEATIRKLDLKLRQLQLQQRILDQEIEKGRFDPTGKWIRRRDNFAVFEGVVGMLGLLVAPFLGLFIAIGAVLPLMHPIIWFGWERKETIVAPIRLQKEIDTLEAEIAHHKKIVEGASENDETI